MVVAAKLRHDTSSDRGGLRLHQRHFFVHRGFLLDEWGDFGVAIFSAGGRGAGLWVLVFRKARA